MLTPAILITLGLVATQTGMSQMHWGLGNLDTSGKPEAYPSITKRMGQANLTLVRGGLTINPNRAIEPQQEKRVRLKLFKEQGIEPLAVGSPWQATQPTYDNPILEMYHQYLTFAQVNPAIQHWELFNERDMAFSHRMPDVDTALMKAAYLGLTTERGVRSQYSVVSQGVKRGKRFHQSQVGQRPIVIGTSLALPEGPWAWRAARNGLWNYADGFNFHYYGLIDSLPTVIDNYRTFVQTLHAQGLCHTAQLPLWLTEINRAFTTPHDLSEAVQIKQGEFLVEAANIAKKKEIVAFLPFTAYWEKEPTFNFFDAQGTPNASWHAYAGFTQSHLTQPTIIANPPHDVPAVILHWEPNAKTTIPHKMSGCYWPRSKGQTIEGNVVITNLGKRAVTGWLTVKTKGTHGDERSQHHATALKSALQNGLDEPERLHILLCDSKNMPIARVPIQLEPQEWVTIPVAIASDVSDYFREWLLFEFDYFRQGHRPAKKGFHFAQNKRQVSPRAGARGQGHSTKSKIQNLKSKIHRSPLYFGIEANPYDRKHGLSPTALALSLPKHDSLASLSHRSRTNQLTGHPLFFSDDSYATYFVNGPSPAKVTSTCAPWLGLNDLLVAQTSSAAFPWMAFTGQHNLQVRNYPCAIARVDGLPDTGFLVLKTNRNLGQDTWIWVYLIDAAGQQFCVWDNQGRNRYIKDNRVFLNLEDFQILFHGAVTTQPQLANIREIHLRFGFSKPNHPIMFNLEFAESTGQPGNAEP